MSDRHVLMVLAGAPSYGQAIMDPGDDGSPVDNESETDPARADAAGPETLTSP